MAARAHAFSSLLLDVRQPDLGGVATAQKFEFRAASTGAEVWRTSEIRSDEVSSQDEPLYVGRIASRHLIEMLTELEHSGVYENQHEENTDDPTMARVSLVLAEGDNTHPVLLNAPADDAVVMTVVQAIHRTVAVAQERALAAAG